MDEIVDQISRNEFFQDFISYLKYIEKQPITLTAKGNISRKDIGEFSNILNCVRKRKEEFDEYKWKIVGDWQLPELDKLRVMAEILNLVRKWKNTLKIRDDGRKFLQETQIRQFTCLVLGYWRNANWDYFDPSPDFDKKTTVLTLLQKNQDIVWRGLWENGEDWIEFDQFAQEIARNFGIEFIPKEWDGNKRDYFVLEQALINHNLKLFGLVETEGKIIFRHYRHVEKLKPTKLGLYMFDKAVKGSNFNMV